METEIWKAIPGFSRYEASNLGRIRSLNYKNTGKVKILKPGNSDRYLATVLLNDENKYRSISVHRMIMLAFKGPSDLEVNHINGIKDDNRLVNLEYCTRSENLKHAYRTGLEKPATGSKNGNSKLTEEQVSEIREYVKSVQASGKRFYGRKELAKKYGVSPCTIKELVIVRTNRKKSWPHI